MPAEDAPRVSILPCISLFPSSSELRMVVWQPRRPWLAMVGVGLILGLACFASDAFSSEKQERVRYKDIRVSDFQSLDYFDDLMYKSKVRSLCAAASNGPHQPLLPRSLTLLRERNKSRKRSFSQRGRAG